VKSVKVAVVQDAPVLFDRSQTLKKIEVLATEASKENPDLILFPEAFIPAYPRGLSFGTVVGSRSEEGRELWLRYWENSISVLSQESERLGALAKELNTYLVIGVTERGETGSLFCTLLYFDRKGNLVGKHRKLKPTGAERIIWGEGDGSDLEVLNTDFGKMGGLICWENYMPLPRTLLYQQGIEIYLAPTADQRDSWQHTMRHIATEGRCFILGCNQYVTKEDYPQDLQGEDLENLSEIPSIGGSVIIDPLGNVVAGPIWDKSGILQENWICHL